MSDLDLSILEGIKDAQETSTRNYLKTNGNEVGSTAKYLLEITNVKLDKNRKKIGFFAVDFIIRESNCSECRVGELANYYTSADKDGFLGNVKNFSAAALSSASGERVDSSMIDQNVIAEYLKDAGEMVRGKKVYCMVTIVPTKPREPNGPPGKYSQHVFSAYLPNQQA